MPKAKHVTIESELTKEEKDKCKHEYRPLEKMFGIHNKGSFAKTPISSATKERVTLLYCIFCLDVEQVSWEDYAFDETKA